MRNIATLPKGSKSSKIAVCWVLTICSLEVDTNLSGGKGGVNIKN